MKFRLLFLLTLLAALASGQQHGGELRLALDYEPRTFNPLAVEDANSEMIRYLTAGTLVKVNRTTLQVEPALATSWKVLDGSRTVLFQLRPGISFSDGAPFDSADVAFTMAALSNPDLHSPTADAFRTGAKPPVTKVLGKYSASITFGAPVAEIVRMFDQVAMMSSRSAKKELAVLGPFYLDDRKAGTLLVLKRNPNYWRMDSSGRRLPYLDSIRIQIQPNRELEALAFRRGELDLMTKLDPIQYEQFERERSGSARDLGPALDSEFMWFNQVTGSRLPDYKRKWFKSTAFRRAVSNAINREDICRIVYRGHARPAIGPYPATNALWYNSTLPQRKYDPTGALNALKSDGFRLDGQMLRDARGNPVTFSLITNAGNKSRERIAAMIQRDLKGIGIQVSIVALDFPSLLVRILRSYDYDAVLLGLTNVDVDPNGMMNVWLSSSSNHQWNPKQKNPETDWEAEIDRNMQAQAALPDQKRRKSYWDRVLQIIWEQEPFIYILHPNALAAVSPSLRNIPATPIRPQTLSEVDQMYFAKPVVAQR